MDDEINRSNAITIIAHMSSTQDRINTKLTTIIRNFGRKSRPVNDQTAVAEARLVITTEHRKITQSMVTETRTIKLAFGSLIQKVTKTNRKHLWWIS